MAMEAHERALLSDTINAVGALSLVLQAALTVLNHDVSNVKPRLLVALTAARSNDFTSIGDARRMDSLARDFINLI
jgi:hypothetical protein